MFKKGTITAYPTNTSYGLAVRVDDREGLENLYNLKERIPGKFFSIMVKDFEMLEKFAEISGKISKDFFNEKPRTIILKPKKKLPKSKFWPTDKVAFRVCSIEEVSKQITYPITATSANKSGETPIFSEQEIKKILGNSVTCFSFTKKLNQTPPSEIWDYTVSPPERIR